MRRIIRGVIPLSARATLQRRAKHCVDVASARREWDLYRASAASTPVVDELTRMAGKRNRCFYCSDSRAADIDHFRPVRLSPRGTFDWKNLQWTCGECNRKKSTRFPQLAGLPLLLDPTIDEPWRHLVLDIETGFLAARYVDPNDQPDARGEATLDVLDILNYEAVTEGRVRVVRQLAAAVRDVLAHPGDSLRWRRLIKDEFGIDEYGCASWFLFWEGRSEEPFVTLRREYPLRWHRLLRTVARKI